MIITPKQGSTCISQLSGIKCKGNLCLNSFKLRQYEQQTRPTCLATKGKNPASKLAVLLLFYGSHLFTLQIILDYDTVSLVV